MPVIETTDLTKRYGDVTALESLTLSVEAGQTFGLLGTNGAGKTTLFKLLVGHINPDAGSVAVAGRDVASAGAAIRETVGYLPEDAGFPGRLTGREVLRFHARMRGLAADDRAARIDDVLTTVGIADAADRQVAGYSNGMQRRLGLATALLARPTILLLDEPTAGLDPLGVAAFHRIVRRLRRDTEITIVLSSHVLTEVEALCESVAVLHEGRLLEAGPVADLRAGTAEGRTLAVRLAAPDADAAVRDLASETGAEVQSVETRTMELVCPRDAVPDLVAALHDHDGVAGYEVREPGLDAVFARAVSERASEEVES
jgi:Cu-processing system ATP-binding protein